VGSIAGTENFPVGVELVDWLCKDALSCSICIPDLSGGNWKSLAIGLDSFLFLMTLKHCLVEDSRLLCSD